MFEGVGSMCYSGVAEYNFSSFQVVDIGPSKHRMPTHITIQLPIEILLRYCALRVRVDIEGVIELIGKTRSKHEDES